jgi:hexokinase
MVKQTVELIQTPDYQQIRQNFLRELTLASLGKPSSISFLKNRIPRHSLLSRGIVQGIVIGGTNYIFTTEEIKPDGARKVIKRKTGVLPEFDTKETFISFFSEYIDPAIDAIGINFGFPLAATTGSEGELDGLPLRGTKEHSFTGLLNKPLGQLVKKLYREKYHKTPLVSVANDTVCLTLSGVGSENGAFVAGTGFNICLAIKNKQKMLVNLESGNFDKFTPSKILQKIDAESETPGGQLLEKTISGKYLALYFNEKIKEFKLAREPIQTSQELSELSHINHTDVAGDLARAIISRSAFLVAATIAALYEFSNKPETFTLIGEGSLLWNGWQYHENIQKQLIKLGVPENTIKIKHIPDSSIKGAIGLVIK